MRGFVPLPVSSPQLLPNPGTQATILSPLHGSPPADSSALSRGSQPHFILCTPSLGTWAGGNFPTRQSRGSQPGSSCRSLGGAQPRPLPQGCSRWSCPGAGMAWGTVGWARRGTAVGGVYEVMGAGQGGQVLHLWDLILRHGRWREEGLGSAGLRQAYLQQEEGFPARFPVPSIGPRHNQQGDQGRWKQSLHTPPHTTSCGVVSIITKG